MVVRLAVVALILLAPAALANPQPVLPPTGLDAQRQGAAVLLSWDAAPEASEYQVFRDGQSLGFTAATNFEDATAPPDAIYWVTAFDDAGHQSPPSPPVLVGGDCLIISQDTFPYVFVHPEDCANLVIRVH